MNKLFIGLLLVVAAAGAFFVLQKKNKKPLPITEIKKEWLTGKWRADSSAYGGDSLAANYRYQFLGNGIAIETKNDTIKADTFHYVWNKSNELLWKENAGDSTGISFTVLKLTSDSLQLSNGLDSTVTLFIKAE